MFDANAALVAHGRSISPIYDHKLRQLPTDKGDSSAGPAGEQLAWQGPIKVKRGGRSIAYDCLRSR